MANKDIALMAHLMRRAGFGATYEELESRTAKGYERPWRRFCILNRSPRSSAI